MTRDISAAVKTASQDRVMSPFLLGEFQIDSGTIYVSSLDKGIFWNADLFDPTKGGFEIDTGAWVAQGSNTIEISTEKAQTGIYSLKTTEVNNSNGAQLYFRDSADLFSDLTVGKKYRVIFWGASGGAYTVWGRIDNGTGGITEIRVNTQTMTKYVNDFICTHATNARFFMSLDAAEVMYIDDISIQPIWEGVGQIGAVSAVEESMALQATGLRMALTGIPGDYVTMVLSEDYQGRPAIMRLGFIDTDLGTIIVDPVIIFQGFIDQMKLTDGDTATIQITCENELIAWQRPNVARYTNADQQALYPGDLGLEFVSQAVEKEIVWGSGPAPVTMYNAYGRSAWVQNYDPFGQPVLPDWWNDPPPPVDYTGAGPGGDGGV